MNQYVRFVIEHSGTVDEEPVQVNRRGSVPSRTLNEGDRSGAGAGALRASPARRVRMVVIARLKGHSTRGKCR